MAMRAAIFMKKILSLPKTEIIRGSLRFPRCFSSTIAKQEEDSDHEESAAAIRYLEKAVGNDNLEKLLKDGSKVKKKTHDEWFSQYLRHGKRDEIDKRWENWVYYRYELWQIKNEEEQIIDLYMRWKYLKDLLNRHGIVTSHHRLLLSMKIIQPDDDAGPGKSLEEVGEEGIVELKIGSPDRGLISVDELLMDRGFYTLHSLPKYLPRQTVNGLLCFTTNKHDAFFIYNPVTGERSPWVETNKGGGKFRRIAFGFNPQSHEHIVIWISGTLGSKYSWRERISSKNDQVVEVFTVGGNENAWRRIDAVPPVAIGREVPFYVNGCLYWRFRDTEPAAGEQVEELIMRFDIVTEKFRVIPIPDFVSSPERRLHKWMQSVELTEIDGRIAILSWINDLEISLWTFHEDADANIKWSEEVIDMPPHWGGGKEDLSIEALTGTNLIFLQSEWSDSIFYYNRSTKESIRFPIPPDESPSEWKRVIQV